MKSALRERPSGTLPHVSSTMTKVFAAYTRGYVRRHFHSFRILKSSLPPTEFPGPLVIFLNHAAWWDPLVCLLLARKFFPNRASFAPIDAAMLERYHFFKHLGFFGVDHSIAGARKFLRMSRTILASPRNVLWITPQGRFIDIRDRPLQLERGLGALAALLENAIFLPLALEYTFWSEPRPEILASFGEPIMAGQESLGAVEWTERLRGALEGAQDKLAARSCRRVASDWGLLNRGGSGVNSIYDACRWFRSRVSRQDFAREHHAEASS